MSIRIMWEPLNDSIVIDNFYLIKNFKYKIKHLKVNYHIGNSESLYILFYPDNYFYLLTSSNDIAIFFELIHSGDNIHYYINLRDIDKYIYGGYNSIYSHIRSAIEEMTQQSMLELLYD